MTANLSILGKTSSEYLQCMESVINRSLRDGLTDLPEPRMTRSIHTRRLLESIIELLAGFTLGTVARDLHAGVSRWFGDAIARELARSFSACKLERLEGDLTYLADAKLRPTVNELATGLHRTYCAMPKVLGGIVRELDTLIRLVAPQKVRSMNLMFGPLCNDADELVRCLADEIRFAWSIFSAAASGKPVPGVEGRFARSARMWSSWLSIAKISSSHAPAGAASVPRDQAQSAGYIMLVA